MISTEGDNVESVVPPLYGLKEGGEGVLRDVRVEVECIAGFWITDTAFNDL